MATKKKEAQATEVAAKEEKEVKMQPTQGVVAQGADKKQLSYEELAKVAVQLQEQNKKLREQVRSISTVFTRLNYLFKILEVQGQRRYFRGEYIEQTVREIEQLMTIPEKEEEKK